RDVGGRRKAGDAPNLGQVGRMAYPEQAGNGSGQRRRRKKELGHSGSSKRSQESRATTLRWTMLLGVLALGLVVGVVVFWLKPRLDLRDKMALNAPRPAKLAPLSALP